MKLGDINVLYTSYKCQKLFDSFAAWGILPAVFMKTIFHVIFTILTREAVKFTTTYWSMSIQ